MDGSLRLRWGAAWVASLAAHGLLFLTPAPGRPGAGGPRLEVFLVETEGIAPGEGRLDRHGEGREEERDPTDAGGGAPTGGGGAAAPSWLPLAGPDRPVGREPEPARAADEALAGGTAPSEPERTRPPPGTPEDGEGGGSDGVADAALPAPREVAGGGEAAGRLEDGPAAAGTGPPGDRDDDVASAPEPIPGDAPHEDRVASEPSDAPVGDRQTADGVGGGARRAAAPSAAADEGRAAADDGERHARTDARPSGGSSPRPAAAPEPGRVASSGDAAAPKAKRRVPPGAGRSPPIEPRTVARGQRRAAQKPSPTPSRWLRFVRTEGPAGVAPDDAEFIAANDVVADDVARPEVIASDPGPRLDGITSRSLGAPSPVQGPPSPELQSAVGRNLDAPEAADGVRHQAAAAPPVPVATTAAPSVPGDETDGTAAADAPASHGAPVPVTAGAVPSLEVLATPPGAFRAVDVAEVPLIRFSDWWEHSAASEDGARALPRAAVTEGSEPAPRPAADLAGSEACPPTAMATPLTAAPAAEQAPTGLAPADTRPPEAREARDPRVRPPKGSPHPVRLTEPYAPRRSPQAVFDDPSDTEAVEITAKSSALGAWAHEVDTLLRSRWSEAQIPSEDAALGLGGEVTLEFLVTAAGKVERVEVVSGSGSALLDAMARLAIPTHVPRPPHGSVQQRVTFAIRS